MSGGSGVCVWEWGRGGLGGTWKPVVGLVMLGLELWVFELYVLKFLIKKIYIYFVGGIDYFIGGVGDLVGWHVEAGCWSRNAGVGIVCFCGQELRFKSFCLSYALKIF